MSGFANPIIGGGGSLVYPSIHSPNYVPGTSGWTIKKDGSVEFNNGTFRGNIVGGALFIYSGAGALGNPPQLAIVPPGTTQDPFGNAVTSSKILMQANVITESGGVFRTAAAAPLIQLDGPHNALLAYDAAAALRETIAPAATTDGLGNNVQAGFTSYGPASTTWARLFQQLVAFHQPSDTGDALVGENGDGSIQLSSAARSATPVIAALNLVPAASGANPLAELTGALDLLNGPQPAQATGGLAGPVAWGSSGRLRVIDGNDAGNYGTERAIQEINGTLPQQITSTTQANVQGLSVPVAAGKYRIRGRLSCTMGGVTGPMGRLVITGPTITQMEVGYWSAQNNPGGATLFTATQTAIGTLTPLTSVNQGINTGFTVQFEGTVTFSAAGTMTLAAAESVVTSVQWQINANSYWEVAPE